uniref:Uncharacterized protein n=1 Tax=Anguilla anguilla TaxID=7936 RepID=A0A0E9PQH6_ANGAN
MVYYKPQLKCTLKLNQGHSLNILLLTR